MTVEQLALDFVTRVHAAPETVFRYFVDADLYRQWQGGDAELDARPGGLYRVRMPGETVVEGTYVLVDAPRRVVFTWGWVGSAEVPPGSTTVEVTLTADEDVTVVRLVHRGLPSASSRDEHAGGWGHYLARLTVAAAGGDPGSDPMAITARVEGAGVTK